jgi:glycogen(starch) synthase
MDVLVYPRRRSRVTELVTPLKPLEAMAMAKAVIGSNVGGLQELIVDGVSGLFYRAGDISDLASKITQLADDPHLCRVLGHQARAAVSAHRDWQSIIPRYVPIYEAVCARRKRTFGQNLLRRAA